MKKVTSHEKYKIKRTWFNSFGQYCYELENGATIYINYDGDSLVIEK